MMPGGLGTTEISSISILNSYGVELSLATISSIMIRLMTLWFATFLELFVLFTQQDQNFYIKMIKNIILIKCFYLYK